LKRTHTIRVSAGTCLLAVASLAFGQDQPAPAPAPAAAADAPAAPAAPAPLPTPAITGPLAGLPPAVFDAGRLGKLSVNGFLSGFGSLQSNHIPGDDNKQAALMNGQLVVQKADGWFQYYIQAGAYNVPSLGVPFLPTDNTITDLWGPLPVAFLRLQAGKNTQILVGSLPTLIGAEYTFSFENMNVERGLLWNQETAISRGIQINQTMGKFSASLSWNDGFYSDRYSWLSGSLAYTNGAHTLAFVGAGNLGQTAYQSFATPVQNNGAIYNLIYTYSKNGFILQPYLQYTDVPTNRKIGIPTGASTKGVAILASKAFSHGMSLAGRFEYIDSSGSAAQNSLNLLFGPGSSGTSITVTPGFQTGGFFLRGDVSWTHAGDFTPGFVFGPKFNDNNQLRAVAEIGFIFGDNIKKP